MEKVRVAWQNEGWTKITTAKDWEKIKGQVVEKPSSEENREFLRRLLIELEGRQGEW